MRKRNGASLLGAAALVVVLAVHAGVYGTWTSDVVYLCVSLAAAAVAWEGVRRSGRRPGTALIAAGVSLSAVGDLLWQVLDWTGGSTDLSVADVCYVTSYLALSAGLWRMAGASGRSRREQADGWIDAAVVFIGALLVVWQLSMVGTLTDASTPLATRLVWVLYPALDVALVGLVFRLVITRDHGSRAALVVAGGAVCWLASDLLFALVDVGGVSVWSDSGWLLGAVLLGAAVWSPAPAAAGAAPRAAADGAAGLSRLAVCLGALVVPTVIDMLRQLTESPLLRVPVFAGTLLLAVLVFLRAARLLRAEAAARAEVRGQQRYSAALAAHSSDAVVVLGSDGQVASDPTALAGLFGGEPAGRPAGGQLLAWTGVDPAEARAVFGRVLEAGHGVVVQAELARADGGRWFGVRLIDLREDDDVRGIVVHATDITDRKLAETSLEHLAFSDPLTGLANRSLLADRVGTALRRPRTTGSVALVLVDLDGFKGVNDTLGHPVGDQLLREVAGRLRAAVRAGDVVARLGGDEFALLVEQDGEGSREAEAVARRVLELLARPFEVEGHRVEISGSLGIAIAAPGATGDSLMGDADLAMYAAKAAGRARYRVFEPALRTTATERREIEQGLRGALANGELRLVYQPVVDLADERVLGFEALLRWRSPVLGDVPPDRFVPVAEEIGLIEEIGAWVLHEACAAAAAWQPAGPGADGLTMAVNVSTVQLASPDLAGVVAAALRASGLAPSLLTVEVTETALVGDPDRAARSLAAVRQLGVRVALDDFGTGASSLGHLRRFDVDVLKIDKSFVATIAGAGDLPGILRGMLDLGRALDLDVVAEGVEHEVHRTSLLAGGCERAQGYLFARPLERADAERSLLRALV